MKRFLVLLLIGFLFLGCTQTAPQPSATPQPSIQAPTATPTPSPSIVPTDARKTFSNTAAGLAFRYDASWQPVTDEDEDAVSLAHIQRLPYEDVRVLGPIPTEDGIQVGAEEYYSTLGSSLNLTLLSSKSLSIGGLDAYRIKAIAAVEDQTLTILLVGVQLPAKPARNYFFYVGASSKTFEQNEEEYDAMAQSLKIS